MNVKVVNDEKSFRKIASEWEKLYKVLEYTTPYQSWSWNYLYWKYFKGKKQLKVFTYDIDGTVSAIFPMWVREQLGLFVLEPIGTRGTDYIHLLLKTEQAENVIDKFLEWFSFSKVDILNLEDIPHSAFYINALRTKSEKHGLFCYLDSKYCSCFEIDLPDRWEDYLWTLSKRDRSDIDYYRRYVARNAENVSYIQGKFIDLKEHFCLHQKVRENKGDKGTYKKTPVRALVTECVSSLENEGLLKLVFLEINKTLCATILGIEKDSARFNITIGHDPAFSNLRPGTLLYGYDIEECIRQGVKKYDLSRGSDSYKYKMGARLKYNTRIVLAKSEECAKQYLENQKIYWKNEDYAPTAK